MTRPNAWQPIETAWVVVNRNGDILTSTLADLRVRAIKRMVGPEEGWRSRWRRWKRTHGCRAAKVSVRLITPPPPGAAPVEGEL